MPQKIYFITNLKNFPSHFHFGEIPICEKNCVAGLNNLVRTLCVCVFLRSRTLQTLKITLTHCKLLPDVKSFLFILKFLNYLHL